VPSGATCGAAAAGDEENTPTLGRRHAAVGVGLLVAGSVVDGGGGDAARAGTVVEQLPEVGLALFTVIRAVKTHSLPWRTLWTPRLPPLR
jgi:hypothetical protein